MKNLFLALLFALSAIALGDYGIDQPNPYISDKLWTAQRVVARKLTATWFRTVLGSRELKARDGDRLSEWGKAEIDRVFKPLAAEGFGVHVTLAGDDLGCLAEVIDNLAARGMTIQIDPSNEDPGLLAGRPVASARYVTRLRWLQTQIAGKRMRGCTGICHGWNGDWQGTQNAPTADFGIELQRHLNQIDFLYAPGSEIRISSGWAQFSTNCYVSPDVWSVKDALIAKARSIEKKVHTYYNPLPIVFAEFGVWLPPFSGNNPYNYALSVGAAAKEVASWPGVAMVIFYAPVGDVNYQLVREDGTEVAGRVSGYRRGLGIR